MIRLSFKEKEIAELRTGLEYLAASRNFELGTGGAELTAVKTDSGLYVEGSNGRYEIGYCRKSDFFRAVSTLVGMLEMNKDAVSVHETGKLKMCGAMIDCSRNAVLKVETAIDIFARMAAAGMNTVMLYTEDTYEVEGYEYFGYMRGRYTKEELKTLDSAAQALGLDMIPCIQTLAHLKTALRWGYADEMRDTDDILLIDEEKTYEFIEAMFKSLRSCCSSAKIHIGMDEAHFVGLGTYMKKHGCRDRFEIMARHLKRVCSIAQKYGFEPMMWSDMFFRIGSKTGAYYDAGAKIPEDLSDNIPESVSMVYWDYYHSDEGFYRTMIKNHRGLKRDIIFAGGVWKWSGMGADYRQTFKTTIPALNACRSEGVDSIIATIWGDDGSEVSVNTTLLGIQLFAEYNYYTQVSFEHLKEKFRLCMGLDAESFLAFEVDNLPEEYVDGVVSVSRQVLYQDVLCGLFDKNMEVFNLPEFYQKKLEKLNNVHDRNFEYLFDYYRALLKVLKEKAHIGVKIKRAYDNNDKAALEHLKDELAELKTDFETMQDKFAAAWDKENKSFGYDCYDIRCGGAIARIKTAIRRLDDYCRGNIRVIEELEENKLYYGSQSTKNKLAGEHCYSKISSASARF